MEGFTKIAPSALIILGYGMGFFFKILSLALKENIQIGTVYAVWSGVGISVISIIDHLFYKQTLDLPAIFGIVLIMIDIIAINQFSKCLSH